MKKLRSTLMINFLGLMVLLVTLFGYKQVKSAFAPPSHRDVIVDKKELKKRLSLYSTEELEKMINAGEEIIKWNAMLAKTGMTILDKVLQGERVFWQNDHYPIDDTLDWETYSQYYYHAHREGEHGHFHLFLRQEGMEKGTLPILYDEPFDDANTYAHLVGISMDLDGYPMSLFTINQWVTAEKWYAPTDLKKMVERFDVKHAYPSYVVNRWLKLMLIFFRPQIDALIEARDGILTKNREGIPLEEILSDREIDVIAEEKISIEVQLKMLRRLEKKGEHFVLSSPH